MRRKAQTHRVARRRVRVLADNEHAHVIKRVLENAENIVARWQVRGLGAEKIAQLKGLPAEQVERQTWENGVRFFGIPQE